MPAAGRDQPAVLGSLRVFAYRFIGIAFAMAMMYLALSTATVLAADPTPGASGLLIDPLDPRAGSGANQVGAPLVALLATIAIGTLTVVLTATYLRLSRTR